MRKKLTSFLGILTTVSLLWVVCSAPPNPYLEPNNSGVSRMHLSISDTTTLGVEIAYTCSVRVLLPEFIDSFYVKQTAGPRVSWPAHGGSPDTNHPWIVFSFTPQDTNTIRITVVVVRTNSTVDSLVTLYSVAVLGNPAPVMTVDSILYHVNLGDSIRLRFRIKSLKANLWMAMAGVDSADQRANLISFGPRTGDTAVYYRLKGAQLLPGLTGALVVTGTTMDFDSLGASAQCTVKVTDVTPPRIILKTDTSVTITAMPFTLRAVVSDDWDVDSVKFNGASMQIKDDTVTISTSMLDTGKTADSIVAWDKAGNRSRMIFHLTYHGVKAYPPIVKIADRSVNEGGVFDSLLLDTSAVTIVDSLLTPAQRYDFVRDSVTWTITDSAGITVPINTASRKAGVKIPIPAGYAFADSEWTGSFRFTVTATEKRKNLTSNPENVVFQVKEIPDGPRIVVSRLSGYGRSYFDTISLDASTTVTDPDNLPSQLQWNFNNGSWLRVDSIYRYQSIGVLGKGAAGGIGLPPIFRTFTRRISVALINQADSIRVGTDTLTFFVTDPTGKTAMKRVGVTRTAKAPMIIIPLFP